LIRRHPKELSSFGSILRDGLSLTIKFTEPILAIDVPELCLPLEKFDSFSHILGKPVPSCDQIKPSLAQEISLICTRICALELLLQGCDLSLLPNIHSSDLRKPSFSSHVLAMATARQRITAIPFDLALYQN
jgi:hypothetical protein